MFSRRFILGALSAATLAGPASMAAAEEIYIPLVSKGFQHQFWQAVKSGAEQAADEFDVTITFEGPDNETMVDRQIDMLAAALANNPKAIGFAALDSQAAIPLLKQANDKGIPVIAFDSGVDSDIPLSTATTDNLAAAGLAADKMAEKIGGKGKVAVVAHDQTSRTGIDRRDGFVNRMAEKYPDIEVVTVQYGQGDHLKSTEVTKAILTANPDLNGIFGTNEGSAIGVVNGVQELGTEGLVIIGYDSGKAQKDAIKSGLMAGAITQNPVGIGYETVKAAVAALNGEEVPALIDTGFYYYDASNIDDPKISAVLYD
ncbi:MULTISPECIES: ABC transporter substrate-binding protein [unclassified Ruegeria]|uniref:ABC transporter substrate-binding protein n=1 Tax=unclassified Ruegeria TaxID=2625375 RepID=UPI001487F7CF|nr:MULTISPECIES: ABC transporter substrate-binding protein [unclassified Ruegeria]NOD77633.1 substrate-binding domain-containing protein [Ruegeria sp. HKCCD4332]NOD89837.1 substrate-binding domain-containing protein [Ruegeria sp. HKCCD4318]NOE14717.1 substrate-binding domain-containing protein [Ruegeria sp. HKCCD4318-2]NOG10929.1 ABC transporter substrate-binding protein [Ruegeria sp. HKCCD4315]